MASALSSKSSLPAKKRKASNASSITSFPRDNSTCTSSVNGVNAATSNTAVIDVNRLPSKKRKGSHDLSIASTNKFPAMPMQSSQHQHEQDDPCFPIHKESIDSSFILDSIASSRKLSDTSSGLKTLDGLFHSPKNGREDIHFLGSSNAHVAHAASALDHLDALGPAPVAAKEPVALSSALDASAKRKDSVDDNSSAATMASSGQRMLLEAIMMASHSDSACGDRMTSNPQQQHHYSIPTSTLSASRRERLESWGGMSDISMPHVDQHHFSSHASRPQHAASIPQHQTCDKTGLVVTINDDVAKSGSIPSRIALTRDREFSIASLSEVSAFNIPIFPDGEVTVSGADLQAYVAAAVASMGDQLAELAGAVELAAGPASVDYESREESQEGEASENDSILSNLMIGAASDGKVRGRLRSWSTGSGMISVDLDAVQAAVDAAQAASAGFHLTNMVTSSNAQVPPAQKAKNEKRVDSRIRNTKRKLPLKRNRAESTGQNSMATLDFMVGASLSEQEIDEIRERTRANMLSDQVLPDATVQPPKKRGRRKSVAPDGPQSNSLCHATPRISNKNKRDQNQEDILPLPVHSAEEPTKQKANGRGSAADQKWDEMFNCLLEFVEERRQEETKDMTLDQKAAWVWDGHVPTNYKRDDKALGRWINNQRSSKGKGTLKADREDRLVAAGLKWSVVTSNAWNEMFEELRIYISEQVAQGKEWNGNVPASYQIKRSTKVQDGEDLLLGRWVNRQRSLYQAGRLKKDRQLKLEEIGLKWSMLVTMSWESMYDSLVDYVQECSKNGGSWDGNVATHYRTNDNPPRALGRWVNRQRSAYAKNKLKKEYMEKLTKLGLKWSVHDRSNDNEPDDDDSDVEAADV